MEFEEDVFGAVVGVEDGEGWLRRERRFRGGLVDAFLAVRVREDTSDLDDDKRAMPPVPISRCMTVPE